MGYRVLEGWSMRARAGKPAQNNRISRFTKMVSAIESAIDQTRQPGMKRTWVRSPDRFQIAIIYGVASTSSGRQSATKCANDVVDGKCEETPPITGRTCSSASGVRSDTGRATLPATFSRQPTSPV